MTHAATSAADSDIREMMVETPVTLSIFTMIFRPKESRKDQSRIEAFVAETGAAI